MRTLEDVCFVWGRPGWFHRRESRRNNNERINGKTVSLVRLIFLHTHTHAQRVFAVKNFYQYSQFSNAYINLGKTKYAFLAPRTLL